MDIISVLRKKHITQVELAARLGINRVSLHSMIHGNPTVNSLEFLAEAIGCSVGDFFAPAVAEAGERAAIRCPHCGKPIALTASCPKDRSK